MKSYYLKHRKQILDRVKLYYRVNRSVRLAYVKEYQSARKKEIAQYQRNYYRSNPVPHKVRARKFYNENRTHILELSKKYRLKNIESIRQKNREWKRNNREKVYHANRMRRISKKNAEGSFSLLEWRALLEFYKFRCLSCLIGAEETRLYPDHVVPLCVGGSNWISNIQPLCRKCNSSKGRKTVDYRNATN